MRTLVLPAKQQPENHLQVVSGVHADLLAVVVTVAIRIVQQTEWHESRNKSFDHQALFFFQTNKPKVRTSVEIYCRTLSQLQYACMRVWCGCGCGCVYIADLWYYSSLREYSHPESLYRARRHTA